MSEKFKASDLELEYLIEYVLSAMIGILCYWLRQEKATNVEEFIKLMYNVLNRDMREISS